MSAPTICNICKTIGRDQDKEAHLIVDFSKPSSEWIMYCGTCYQLIKENDG